MAFDIGARVHANGFAGTIEGFARQGELAVVMGYDGMSSRRIPVGELQSDEPTYADRHNLLLVGKARGWRFRIEMNDGVFDATAEEALDEFDEIAPGEAFVILGRIGMHDETLPIDWQAFRAERAGIRTGAEVATFRSPEVRGVVVDGIPKKSGPNRGRIEVMWIGGRYTVSAWPHELQPVK